MSKKNKVDLEVNSGDSDSDDQDYVPEGEVSLDESVDESNNESDNNEENINVSNKRLDKE
jgi:hypothetical protein